MKFRAPRDAELFRGSVKIRVDFGTEENMVIKSAARTSYRELRILKCSFFLLEDKGLAIIFTEFLCEIGTEKLLIKCLPDVRRAEF